MNSSVLLSQAGGSYTVPSGPICSKTGTKPVSSGVRNLDVLRIKDAYVSSCSRSLSTKPVLLHSNRSLKRSKRGHQFIVVASPKATVATEPLTREHLIAYHKSGRKPRGKYRIGTKHEKFGFEVNTLRPLKYDRIAELLNGIAERYKWEQVMEDDKIIGLKQGEQSISLKPGGQFEFSVPHQNLGQMCREICIQGAEVTSVGRKMGIGFLGLDCQPKWRIMPKERYDIMGNNMPKVGSLGLDMMLRSSTVQVSLDFMSEADMIRKFRAGLALQPIATALFANSPFTDGKPNGFPNMKSHIWTDTDKDRTGMLPFVFDDSFGFEQYVDYALSVPMYYAYRNKKYVDCSGMTFRQFLAGKLPCLPGELPSYNDWENHLTTIFPEVRLKRYLEMRVADGGPWRRLCAIPAFWVGLLYDHDTLIDILRLTADWTPAEREMLRNKVPVTGLETPFRDGLLKHVAEDVLKLAKVGLERRGCCYDYLGEVTEMVRTGVTPEEKRASRVRGTSVRRITREFYAI